LTRFGDFSGAYKVFKKMQEVGAEVLKLLG
jgi:pentatricopeptide repeat protein